jgi:hypothetical protein
LDNPAIYLAVIVPLAVIFLLAFYFYRVFTRSSARDRKYLEEVKMLENLKKSAEFRSAKLISVQPYQASIYAPGLRTVNIRLEIEDTPGNFHNHSCKWQIDDYFASSYQPGEIIQVKVLEDFVFPSGEDAKLLPD